MPKLNQKGIAQVLVLVLLLGGITAGVYLVQQRTNLLPKASHPVSGPIYTTPTIPTPVPDSDNDGFTDSVENFMGTDPMDPCSDDKKDDAWPPDVDNNRKVNSADFNKVQNLFKKITKDKKEYNKRYDLNASGGIDNTDLDILRKYMNKTCQDTPAGTSCKTDSDCQQGYICKIVPLGKPCPADGSDCPASSGICVAHPSPSPSYSYTTPGSYVTPSYVTPSTYGTPSYGTPSTYSTPPTYGTPSYSYPTPSGVQ